MENWGLITYRTTTVLFDEGKSDSRYKNRIAYVVAHGKPWWLWYGCYEPNDVNRASSPVVWQLGDYGLVE
jgi:hypothetical protein